MHELLEKALLFLLAIFAATFLLLDKTAHAEEPSYFVVRAGVTLNARSGPGSEYSVYQKLAPGTELKRLNAMGDWLFVQMAGGKAFWVSKAFVDPLAKPGKESPTETRAIALRPLLQQGHTANVSDLTFSQDGRFAVTGGDDHVVRLWDTATGQLIRTFRGHERFVSSVAISQDNRFVAAGGGALGLDTFVFVWDSLTGNVITRYEGHSQTVRAVTFSPDGKLIASGAADNTVQIWNVKNGKQVATLGGIGNIAEVEFSGDGRLVMGVAENKIRVWNVRKFDEVSTIFSGGDLTHAVFDQSGRFIYSTASNRSNYPLKKWDISTGQSIQDLEFDKEPVSGDMAISTDGELLALYGDRGESNGESVVFFDTRTGRETRRSRTPSGHDLIAMSPKGDILIAQGSTVEIRSANSGKVTHTLTGNLESVAALSVGRSGNILAVANSRRIGGDNNWGALWDLKTGEQKRVFRDWNFLGVEAMALSPSSDLIATGAFTSLKWWRLSAEDTFPKKLETRDSITALTISADDGRNLALTQGAGEPVNVIIWDDTTGKTIDRKPLPEASLAPPVFSEDGSHILLGQDGDTENERALVLRRATDFAEVARIRGASATGATLSADGSLIAYLNQAGVPEIVAVRNGQAEKLHEFVQNRVNAMSFSPDGRKLIAGSDDGEARLWSIETGSEIAKLEGHRDRITKVRFSADGDLAISGGEDGLVRLWDAVSGKQRAMLSTFEDGSWIAITPEGFFNASANGAKKLGLIDGLDVLAVDQTFDALYRPDLVAEALAGDPTGKVSDAASKLDLAAVLASGAPPRIAIAEPQSKTVGDDHISVTIEIEDAGGGVGRIEWRVNGQVLGIDTARSDDKKLTRRLPLLPGDNEIVVIAYNRAELIASKPAMTTISRTTSKDALGRLFVLTVGINDYADNALDLKYALADAQAIGDAFRKTAGSLYGEANIFAVSDANATESGIGQVIDRLSAEIRPEDTFVFFAAGHGKTEYGRYFFIPHDFNFSGGDALADKAIGQEEFQRWFAQISAFRSVLMFDTCESGTLAESRDRVARFVQLSGAGRLVRAIGRTTLAASSATEPALEGYKGHGVFTYSVLEALSKADRDGNDKIAVDELAEYLGNVVPEYSDAAFRSRQIPQILISGSTFELTKKAEFNLGP